MTIPFAPSASVIRSYKIMPRAVNAHAYVNATFSMMVDSGFVVTNSPSLVFGGISTQTVRHTKKNFRESLQFNKKCFFHDF